MVISQCTLESSSQNDCNVSMWPFCSLHSSNFNSNLLHFNSHSLYANLNSLHSMTSWVCWFCSCSYSFFSLHCFMWFSYRFFRKVYLISLSLFQYFTHSSETHFMIVLKLNRGSGPTQPTTLPHSFNQRPHSDQSKLCWKSVLKLTVWHATQSGCIVFIYDIWINCELWDMWFIS